MKVSLPVEQPEFIPTRESLLSRLKDWDDAESWREFFERYWRLIYSVARKSGLTEMESQEVVQETLITVSRNIPDFKYNRKEGSFKSWLLHTTRWKINDQLRKRQREDAVLHRRASPLTDRTATIERVADPAPPGLEGLWDEEWENNIVTMAIDRVKQQVKPRQYQIFDLYVVKKWPLGKITSTLGVNMGQIYLAKHRIGSLIKKEVRNLQGQLI
ncbi:MAG TPA: sigma-70 family RNA polymerase sigma factor [Verrucomicrobiae bacterium]|nr:sigma-70 family RNA polymerase sigma factor [Verrucomicrobiae bacterium]